MIPMYPTMVSLSLMVLGPRIFLIARVIFTRSASDLLVPMNTGLDLVLAPGLNALTSRQLISF